MNRSRTVLARGAGAGLLLWSLPAVAELPPDAGQLLERSRDPLTILPLAPPRIELPQREATSPPVATIIPVRRFRIRGATVFPEATLHAVVAEAEGRHLTLGELQALAARISRYYYDRGYLLARAYLPPQEIREGVVEIAVQEGWLERVDAEDSAGLAPGLRRRLNAVLPRGRPLRQDALERAVLLNDALPGIAATARLRAGDLPGGTVAVMETRPEERWMGALAADNHGDRYTGREQGELRLEWNNPSGRGDQLALRLQSAGEGRVYGRLGYDFALNGPWRGTAVASGTRYELGEEFSSLEADGRAETATLELRYPLVLRPALRLNAFAGADYMRMVDRIGITATERDKSLVDGRLGIALQGVDRWHGQSALNLQLISGRLDIHDPAEQRFDAASAGTEGGFSKISLAGESWRQLPYALQLRVSASLQRALDNLTSAQKLPIGGPNGVRAYPTGEAQGDDGGFATLELRRAVPLASRWPPSVIAFADYGRVRFNHEPWTGLAGDTRRELSAAGIGIDWSGPAKLGLTAWQAWPLTDEQVTAESDRNHRFWISARIGF